MSDRMMPSTKFFSARVEGEGGLGGTSSWWLSVSGTHHTEPCCRPPTGVLLRATSGGTVHSQGGEAHSGLLRRGVKRELSCGLPLTFSNSLPLSLSLSLPPSPPSPLNQRVALLTRQKWPWWWGNSFSLNVTLACSTSLVLFAAGCQESQAQARAASRREEHGQADDERRARRVFARLLTPDVAWPGG